MKAQDAGSIMTGGPPGGTDNYFEPGGNRCVADGAERLAGRRPRLGNGER